MKVVQFYVDLIKKYFTFELKKKKLNKQLINKLGQIFC